eukprot:213475_1
MTYTRIKAIIGEYHALYEDDAQIDTKGGQFIKRLDTQIKVEVSNDMFGNKMKVNTAKQIGNRSKNNLFGAKTLCHSVLWMILNGLKPIKAGRSALLTRY